MWPYFGEKPTLIDPFDSILYFYRPQSGLVNVMRWQVAGQFGPFTPKYYLRPKPSWGPLHTLKPLHTLEPLGTPNTSEPLILVLKPQLGSDLEYELGYQPGLPTLVITWELQIGSQEYSFELTVLSFVQL